MTQLADIIDLQNREFFESAAVSTQEWSRLNQWICSTLPYVRVSHIEKIGNKYLYAAFQVRKHELGGGTVTELLHSTAADNVPSIQKDNLDWRRVSRARYGVGTSFSKNADYANYYSSWSGGSSRVFVICDVLLKNRREVTDNRDVYPHHSDYYQSAMRRGGHVYVKFDDFTYWPKYAIYYTQPERKQSAFYKHVKRVSYDDDSLDMFEYLLHF